MITGFVLGAICPVIGFYLTEIFYTLLTNKGILPDVVGYSMMLRIKTMSLIAICFNLFPFELARYKKWDNTLRGIVFPTLIYIAFWLYKYFNVLFN